LRCLRRALQALGAFAVIAAALLDPLQPAIGIAGLVGVVLIDASVHARLAFAFLGVFWIDLARENRRTGGGGPRRRRRLLLGRFLRCSRSRSCGSCRGRRRIGAALGLAEIVPLLAAERAVFLGGLVLRAAFPRGQRLRRRSGGKGKAGKRRGAKQFGLNVHP